MRALCLFRGISFALLAVGCHAATFGTAVPVRGTVSDLALDESRGRLYLANFSAGRIEILNTRDLSFGAPVSLAAAPSALALSPDNHYLVAGSYAAYATPAPPAPPPAPNGLVIIDLTANTQQTVTLTDPVLAMAFGAASQALVVTTKEFLLLDPATGATHSLGVANLKGNPLPVPFGTFPPNITDASTGVSGDGQVIYVLAESNDPQFPVAILQYHIGGAQVNVVEYITSPPLGPRSVSVNYDGTSFLAGWLLFGLVGRPDGAIQTDIAQFPYAQGDFRSGGVAFDWKRNLIYADVPVTLKEAPVLHIVDSDNLTVHERIRLPQSMTGRSVFSGDMQTLYAISDSGIMVLPVGSVATTAPRVAARQEDVLFQSDSCNRSVISQFVDIVDLGGGNIDFSLSTSPANGISLSQTSGTTPARVRIDVNPAAFQQAKGTTIATLNIQSAKGVGIPAGVRLLINVSDFNQRGTIVDVPGRITDILADPQRNRVYLVRQDKNLVLVYDATTFKPIPAAALRTGNTPMGMAITQDQKYLLVGNDNSKIANVFDLDTLQPVVCAASQPLPCPIWFGDNAAAPHMIAVGNGAIWATARSSDVKTQGLYRVNFDARSATPPPVLGLVFCNTTATSATPTAPSTCPIPPTAALAASPSGNYIMLALADGSAALWQSGIDRWVESRHDFTSFGGAFGALSDNLFVVDNNLLDLSLYPAGTLQNGTGSSSGVIAYGNTVVRATAAAATAPGTLERIDTVNLRSYSLTPAREAPQTPASWQATPPVGQIGQSILPFSRTVAVSPDQSSIILLTQSGLTVAPQNFDAPTPIPSVTGVTNLADSTPAVAPGGLIQISGAGLAPAAAGASALPLPTSLGESCVTVNGTAIPLFLVSDSEIAAQLPFTASGNVPLVVHNPGGLSSPFSLAVQDFAPAIFHNGAAGDQTGLATVVRDSNNELVTFANPIHPNEMISIYLTGLGQTSPPAPLGDAAPADPLAVASTAPSVTLGGQTLAVMFAGLVPGEVGVYQINAYVPRGIREASQTPLVVTQGAASTSLTVRVVNP